eukprot:Seg2570.4 transcript_id=Seg2570.4/GoldUCD/mRNA.D3Y31 product="hypothetical protein" protein_id=Seg2570.4/GoldUCD/D3Y31
MKTENSTQPCSEGEVQARSTRTTRHAIRKSNVSLKCNSCQRRFPSFLRLQRHLSVVHKGAGKLFWCSKCSLAFNDLSSFVKHTRNNHQVGGKDGGPNQQQQHDEMPMAVGEEEAGRESELNDQENVQIGSIRDGASQESEAAITESKNETALHPEGRFEAQLENQHQQAVDEELSQQNPTGYEVPDDLVSVNVPSLQGSAFETIGHRGNRQASTVDRSVISSESQSQDEALLTGVLSDHPTMANIRPGIQLMNAITSSHAKEVRPKRATRQLMNTRQTSMIGKQIRQTGHNQKKNKHTVSHYASRNNGRESNNNNRTEDLNINLPDNVKTINLLSNANEADLQGRAERSEILMYLRTVTSKLDAIIRHFNVPYSELGSGLLRLPISSEPTQQTVPHRQSVSSHTSVPKNHQNGLIHQSVSESNHKAKRPNEEVQYSPWPPNSMTSPISNQSMPVERKLAQSEENTTQTYQAPLNTPLVIPNESVNFDGTPNVTAAALISMAASDSPTLEQSDNAFGDVILPEVVVQDLHAKSLNRGNFAKQLVFYLFSPEERRGKNCFGRRTGLQSGPKAPLDPVRLDFVREKVFHYYPCDHGLEETIWRRQCVIAVDTALRGENRPHKKLSTYTP